MKGKNKILPSSRFHQPSLPPPPYPPQDIKLLPPVSHLF